MNILDRLSDKQLQFVSCRFKDHQLLAYSPYRGAGLTTALLADFFLHAAERENRRGILFRENYHAITVLTLLARTTLDRLAPEMDVGFSPNELKFSWSNGSTLVLRPYNQENIDSTLMDHHGHEYDWIGIDCIDNLIKPELYLRMANRWRRSARMRATISTVKSPPYWIDTVFYPERVMTFDRPHASIPREVNAIINPGYAEATP